MENTKNNINQLGWIIILIFLSLLSFAGYLSYKSIDWIVLDKLEEQQLTLPTSTPQSISPTQTK